MTKEELRQQAAINVLNALLETTDHSVLESTCLKDIYAKVAVMYADSLINALEIDEEGLRKWFSKEKFFEKVASIEKWVHQKEHGVHQKEHDNP